MNASSSMIMDPESQQSGVREAVSVLRRGGVAALPTDTVYGLAAAFDDEDAVRRVFRIKRRAIHMPLPLLIAAAADIDRYAARTPDTFWALAERFWPGGLTLALPKRDGLSPLLTGGGATIGLRAPDHWAPRGVAAALGKAITGTSANVSGAPSPLEAQDVIDQLGAAVDLVIDGGRATNDALSTVLDLSGEAPKAIRIGKISLDDINACLAANGLPMARSR